jgi:L-alanine-DL-glutamate epimerase-like enolase superfamily enzyme
MISQLHCWITRRIPAVLQCQVKTEGWELIEPFVTARDSMSVLPVITVTLTDDLGRQGRAEAAGVDYDGETPGTMSTQLSALYTRLDDKTTGEDLLEWLPSGGARNALDCALWDLRAKQRGLPVWQLAGLDYPRPLESAFTIGLGDEPTTRRKARESAKFPLLKIKVNADVHLDAIRWVREERPTARLIIDANQGWSYGLLAQLLPQLQELGVELIEQPLPRGTDWKLGDLDSPIPIAADESCTDRTSLPSLIGKYQYITIKLDKCGGLSEALAMCRDATRLGFGLMVGNMCGSSLAMAPAFLIAQSCRYVDLDGPLLQRQDRSPPIRYEGALMHAPEAALWG